MGVDNEHNHSDHEVESLAAHPSALPTVQIFLPGATLECHIKYEGKTRTLVRTRKTISSTTKRNREVIERDTNGESSHQPRSPSKKSKRHDTDTDPDAYAHLHLLQDYLQPGLDGAPSYLSTCILKSDADMTQSYSAESSKSVMDDSRSHTTLMRHLRRIARGTCQQKLGITLRTRRIISGAVCIAQVYPRPRLNDSDAALSLRGLFPARKIQHRVGKLAVAKEVLQLMYVLRDQLSRETYDTGRTLHDGRIESNHFLQACELSKVEMTTSVPPFLDKLARHRPRFVCFVGMMLWEIVKNVLVKHCTTNGNVKRTSREKTQPGSQAYRLVYTNAEVDPQQETLFFVVPCTSGRVVKYQIPDKIALFAELQRLVQGAPPDIDTSTMEIVSWPSKAT
ncbi:hypothetical protein PAXRUDRAFT_825083 [Paxillus rubicundulus Ve08.2h10]|uniref:Uncharacterized protein n=1 Tax=Paxillus rubicundulus Ve08.2h10 TaxID=930991 RepID=A0A0D0DGV7_9AGAM|nr:hypothetical protein PAXRUDRAFT_825083 [Paxillus rubicundulus Ve08.2h10]